MGALATLRILFGLMHLAKASIVHCDLKSGNVLCRRTSGALRACISDFGLCRPDGKEVGCKYVFSTSFRPWELIHHGQENNSQAFVKIRPLHDMWAYGCLAYEVLSCTDVYHSCLLPHGCAPWASMRVFHDWLHEKLKKHVNPRLSFHVQKTLLPFHERFSAARLAAMAISN